MTPLSALLWRAGSDQDPEQVREQVEQILGRPEFSYEKSLVRRFLDWLGSLLERLMPRRTVPLPASGGGPGTMGIMIAVVLLLAAVVVIVLALRKLRRSRRRRSSEATADIAVSVRDASHDDEWLDEALGLEAAGDWKGSVLLRYRKLVAELVARKAVGSTPGVTPGEIDRELGTSYPLVGELIDEATRIFEDPWYGDLPTGAAEVERLDQLSAGILAGVRAEAGSVDHPEERS